MPIVVHPDNKKRVIANLLKFFIFDVLPELTVTLQTHTGKNRYVRTGAHHLCLGYFGYRHLTGHTLIKSAN
jgi:hypothetical protein